MAEARLVAGDSGLVPDRDGWFVVNVRDAQWRIPTTSAPTASSKGRMPRSGISASPSAWLPPGKPNCLYHRESLQEGFLILAGECLLLVDGQERQLKAWDYFHCPPGVDHVFVGAGDAPCAILMAGARRETRTATRSHRSRSGTTNSSPTLTHARFREAGHTK